MLNNPKQNNSGVGVSSQRSKVREPLSLVCCGKRRKGGGSGSGVAMVQEVLADGSTATRLPVISCHVVSSASLIDNNMFVKTMEQCCLHINISCVDCFVFTS